MTRARALAFSLPFLAAALAGCGSSDSSTGAGGSAGTGASAGSGGNTGGAGTGGASSGGSAGNSGGGSSGSGGGGASGGTGGAAGSAGTGGSAGACAATPGKLACGTATCDTSTEFCCGGPEAGVCMALGAFCGAGGGIKVFCDDKADCAADEECCVGPTGAALNDSQYQATCVKPTAPPDGNVYGCGTTPGNLPWPSLCACSADCVNGSCTLGSIPTSIYSTGYHVCQ